MAMGLTSLFTLAFNFLFPPFFVILSVTLILASFGKSLGVRRLYVKVLLHIFDFVRKITIAHHKRRRSSYADDDEDLYPLEEEDHHHLNGHATKTTTTATMTTTEDMNDNTTFERTIKDVAYKREQMKKYGKISRHNVISRRDNLMLSPDCPPVIEEEPFGLSGTILSGQEVSENTNRREFELQDVFDYVKTGIGSVIEDEVTQRFVAEELKTWNLLSRTSQSFEFINIKLTVIWILGFLIRYCILLPGRICILLVGLLWMGVCMAVVGQLPEGKTKKWLHYHVFTGCFQILGGSISAVITYHNPENKPKRGICVANHTSPIDVLILACDNAYALIGQGHDGFIGFMQHILQRASSHIWFERGEYKDRIVVVKRLREHVEDKNKLPILIFPEGTCINNTSVMQFKKGSFEVGGIIYPVAIKYDPKFGDAFWNSSKNGMLSYIYMMMTSWAIVCDVWYLPSMEKLPEEDAITFANRVKSEIARQGGLVDLMWDGNLKRMQVKSEWKAKQQQEFSKRLKIE